MSAITVNDFDIDKVVFSDPQQETIEKGGKKIMYNRMKMWYEKEGVKLNLISHKLFSFGVQESKSMDDSTKVNGYECNFSLISKPNENIKVEEDEDGNQVKPSWEEMGANKEEAKFLNILDALHTKAAKKLLEVKAKCGLGKVKNLDAMLEKLSYPYKFMKDPETKMPVYNKSPTLKAKLIVIYKDMSILTRFYDDKEENVEVLSLLKNRFEAIVAFAIESIYIGDAYTTFQIKLPEATVYPTGNAPTKRLTKSLMINNIKTTDSPQVSADNLKDTKSEKKSLFPSTKKTIPIKQINQIVKKLPSKKKEDDINELLGSDDE
jgi:hypothetical protein